jgi:hypothetical protein
LRARLQDNVWLRAGFALVSAEVDGDLAEKGLPPLEDWVLDLESLTAFISEGEDPVGTFGVLMRPGEEGHFAAGLATLKAVLAQDLEASLDADGLTVFSGDGLDWETPSGSDTREVAILIQDDLLGLVLSDAEGTARQAVEAARAGTASRPAGLVAADDLLDGAQITLHVDLAALMELVMEDDLDFDDMEPFMATAFEELLRGLGPAAVGLRFGEGQEVEGLLHFSFDPETVLGDLNRMFIPFDASLLKWAPSGSPMVQIMGFDFAAALDAVLAIVAEQSPESYDEYEQGLESLQQATGVHVVDDLLSELTGNLASFFTEPPDFEAVDSGEGIPGLGYVFGLHDSAAFERNLLAVLEPTGFVGFAEVTKFKHGNLYSLAPMGMPVAIGVGAGGLGLLMGDTAIAHASQVLDGVEVKSAAQDGIVRNGLNLAGDAVSVSIVDLSMMTAIGAMVESELGEDLGLEGLFSNLEGSMVVVADAGSDNWTVRMLVR